MYYSIAFSTVQALFLAMAFHPAVQKKAQAELDAVVGPTRLPDLEDRSRTSRQSSKRRFGGTTHVEIAHVAGEDDELREYFVPAGTIMMSNIWPVSFMA